MKKLSLNKPQLVAPSLGTSVGDYDPALREKARDALVCFKVPPSFSFHSSLTTTSSPNFHYTFFHDILFLVVQVTLVSALPVVQVTIVSVLRIAYSGYIIDILTNFVVQVTFVSALLAVQITLVSALCIAYVGYILDIHAAAHAVVRVTAHAAVSSCDYRRGFYCSDKISPDAGGRRVLDRHWFGRGIT